MDVLYTTHLFFFTTEGVEAHEPIENPNNITDRHTQNIVLDLNIRASKILAAMPNII
jgi:hypothetical protein